PDAHGMQGDSWLAVKLRAFQGKLDQLSEKYAQVILWALNNRRFTLGLAVASLAVAMLFAKFVGKEFVPEPDLSEISIKFSTPVGSTLAYTEQKSAQVGLLARQFPGVLDTYATINTGMDIGKHKASVRVLLKPKAERALSQKELINAFREQLKAVSGIEVNSVAPAKESIGSLKPIQISLQGNDMQVLQRLAAEFQQKLGSVPGLIDLESSLKASRPTLSLQVDRERAADLGLSVGRIGSALRPLIAGETVTTWQAEDGENYNVRVRLPGDRRQSVEDVTLLPVASGRVNPVTGQPEMITVGQVAAIKETVSAAQINRRNLFREVLFSGNVTGRPAGDVGADIEKVAAGIAMPAGYRIVTQGANNDMKESVGYATTALVLGALFIYMLLGAQFNSFLHPLTIMTALPLSLVGVFMALFVCRSSMNMFSIIGIVMLMGLVTKNAILLVDFIQELMIKEGLPREKAILQAGQTRLRPILMTTAAMIAGMIPLALGLGEGAEQRAPMAHALIGGLLTSTVLTLIVVPVMYTCLDDVVKAFPRLAFILRRPSRFLPKPGVDTVRPLARTVKTEH
ncbi:MAG TPA: efflux RND transporter permease subunit, partial [Fluviicoccus sp.]|nr:efflux RND transporter permease subunit [Fluviicoccus sp.]